MQLKHTLLTSLFVFIAAAGVCDSGLYQALSPLAAYAPAKSFCSQRYPPGTTTATVTKGAVIKRSDTKSKTTTAQARSTTKSSTKVTVTVVTSSTTKTTSTKATTTKDSKAAAWSSLSAQAGAILSTFCSCIQPLKTVTTSIDGPSTTTIITVPPSPTPTCGIACTATTITNIYAPECTQFGASCAACAIDGGFGGRGVCAPCVGASQVCNKASDCCDPTYICGAYGGGYGYCVPPNAKQRRAFDVDNVAWDN